MSVDTSFIQKTTASNLKHFVARPSVAKLKDAYSLQLSVELPRPPETVACCRPLYCVLANPLLPVGDPSVGEPSVDEPSVVCWRTLGCLLANSVLSVGEPRVACWRALCWQTLCCLLPNPLLPVGQPSVGGPFVGEPSVEGPFVARTEEAYTQVGDRRAL